MSLFRQKKEGIQKNYGALLGDTTPMPKVMEIKDHDKVTTDQFLELSPQMIAKDPHDQGPKQALKAKITERSRVQARDKELARALTQSNTQLEARDQELLARQKELIEAHFDLTETRHDLGCAQQNYKAQKRELSGALSQMSTLRDSLETSQAELETSRKLDLKQAKKLKATRNELHISNQGHQQAQNELADTQQKLANAHNLLQKADKIMASRKAKLESARKDLTFTRDELGVAENALSETRDQLVLSEFRRSRLSSSYNEVATLSNNLENLRRKLEASKRLIKDKDVRIETLSEALSISNMAREKLETRLLQNKTKLIEANSQLTSLQKTDDQAQTEIKLLSAKNRALQARLETLRSELNSLAPRPDIIPAALSRFRADNGQTDLLVKALEKSKANEVSLAERMESAKKDMVMMENVNAMLRQKFSAFSRPDLKDPSYIDELSIPRRNIK